MEYHSIKWLDDKCASRYTKEVEIKCVISTNGKEMTLHAIGDCEHHLIEDSLILLKKVAEVKCGGGHE